MSNGSEDHHLAYTCFIWKGGHVQWFQKAVRNGTPNLFSSFPLNNYLYNIHNTSFLVKFPWHISKLSGASLSVKFSIKLGIFRNMITGLKLHFKYGCFAVSMWNFRGVIFSLIVSQHVAHQVRWNRLCQSPMGQRCMILHTHRIHGHTILPEISTIM